MLDLTEFYLYNLTWTSQNQKNWNTDRTDLTDRNGFFLKISANPFDPFDPLNPCSIFLAQCTRIQLLGEIEINKSLTIGWSFSKTALPGATK